MLSRLSKWWTDLTRRSTSATSTLYQPQPWLLEALHEEPTVSGVHVDGLSSLHATAVYSCVRVLAESVGALPLHLYQRDGDRTRMATEHPLYPVLNFKPNYLMTSYDLRSWIMMSLCLHGNFYGEIVRDEKGNVTACWPLRADRMILTFLPNEGRLDYTFAQPGGPTYHFDYADIVHIRALSYDGLVGISPITAAKNAIGLAIQQERFAGTYFGNGLRLGGVIEHPEALGDEGMRNLQQSFKKMYAGPSAFHDIAVLEEGAKFTQFQLRADEAQFLESRKYSVQDIARVFRIPSFLINDISDANYSNIVALRQEFVTSTLVPWLTNIEQELMLKLLRPTEQAGGYYIQHDLTAQLRGDHESRMKAYQAGIQCGIYSPNDCRRMEHLDPREGGDTYLQAVNMAPSPFNPQAKNN